MTGEKNRFKTTEKLWDLDDKQLKSPQHDAMVLWLMDETNLKNTIKFHCKLNEEHMWFNETYEKNEVITDDISIITEKPIIASSNGFIGGYADLTGKWEYTKCVEYVECPLDIEWVNKIEEAATVSEIETLVKEYGVDSFSRRLKDRYYNDIYEHWWVDEEGNRIKKVSVGADEPENAVRIKKDIVTTSYVSPYNSSVFDLKLIDFMSNVGIDYEIVEYIERWASRERHFHKVKHNYINFLIEVKPYIDSFGAVLRQIKSYKEFIRRNQTYGYDFYFLFTFDDRFDNQFESQGITVLHPPADVSVEDMREMYGL